MEKLAHTIEKDYDTFIDINCKKVKLHETLKFVTSYISATLDTERISVLEKSYYRSYPPAETDMCYFWEIITWDTKYSNDLKNMQEKYDKKMLRLEYENEKLSSLISERSWFKWF